MSDSTSDRDSLTRFLFENKNVRGEIVHLDSVWQTILGDTDYPPVVRDILGEALAAVALLTAVLKMNGLVTLQIQSDGPISMLVAQCTTEQTLRGLAHWSGEVKKGSLFDLCGKGNMSITIEPQLKQERFQGIVELGRDSLAQTLEGYFEQTEQLGTRLWLAADAERAAGMLLQEMPGSKDDADAWDRVTALGNTLERDELMTLDAQTIIHRLYHEEDVRLFEPWQYSFRCTCRRDKVESVLRSLGYDEVRQLLSEQGKVTSHCEFCNRTYSFDPVDVEALFAADNQPTVPKTHH